MRVGREPNGAEAHRSLGGHGIDGFSQSTNAASPFVISIWGLAAADLFISYGRSHLTQQL
jgi:hypothetical protein